MRQVMPHRNNIAMHRTKCKRFFSDRFLRALEWTHSAVYFVLKIEAIAIAFRYNHTKQCFMKTVGIIILASIIETGMAHMHLSQDSWEIRGAGYDRR